jgi:hypothetical protein
VAAIRRGGEATPYLAIRAVNPVRKEIMKEIIAIAIVTFAVSCGMLITAALYRLKDRIDRQHERQKREHVSKGFGL